MSGTSVQNVNNSVAEHTALSRAAGLWAGLLMTGPRWVLGWMFFSAFWRRVVLEHAKHDPNSPAYIGVKFNTFLPNALEPVKSTIEFFVTHPELLYWKLWLFTGIELLVGAALILGLASRLAGLGAAMLSWGILWGAGWLGSTCLDEWQIGSMGVAIGLGVALAGAGPWSLDALWQRRWPRLARNRWMWLIGSQAAESEQGRKRISSIALFFAAIALGMTIFTNQAFHGGVYGKLHNDSVTPHIVITNASLAGNMLIMTVYRDKGPDTYGAFIVRAQVRDSSQKALVDLGPEDLASKSSVGIVNHYLPKVETGPFGLIVPLAAKAEVATRFSTTGPIGRDTALELVLTDVSGRSWSAPVTVH